MSIIDFEKSNSIKGVLVEFTLGYIKSEKQMILKTFNPKKPENSESKVLDIDNIKDLKIDALMLDDQLETNSLNEQLNEVSVYFPIRNAKDFSLDVTNFQNLSQNIAQSTYKKMQNSWTLQNNLKLLEELVQVVKNLKSLWPNNRGDFFEELWFLLKTNLGASSLTLIYNDLKKSQKENEKDGLMKIKIEGETIPNPSEGSEVEEAIFKNYESEFGLPFHICDHDLEKGELVATIMIKQSPILLMAKQIELTKVQKSLLSTFIQALDEFI